MGTVTVSGRLKGKSDGIGSAATFRNGKGRFREKKLAGIVILLGGGNVACDAIVAAADRGVGES